MNRIKVFTEGAVYEGLEVPSSDDSVTMVKLNNGYNIGINKDKIKKVERTEEKLSSAKVPKLKTEKDLPKISLITTGGTIMSKVDYKTGANSWLTKPEELLAQIPELSKLANLKIISPYSVATEDMGIKEWQDLAEITAKELNDQSVSGVIITLGTDTMHYISAALSFMVKTPNKPVAFVGGQRSSDRGSFDGAQNLICAVHYCLSDIATISIVMHESTEDTACIAIRGVKARKMHCSKRNTFRPINDLPLARIWPDGKIEILNDNCAERSNEKVLASTKMEPKVALIKWVPDLDPEVLDFYLKNNYRGIIIEGTGFGNTAVKSKKSWLPAIKKAADAGVFVGMTSQCLYGRTDAFVYDTGRYLQQAGVVYLKDILPETAYVKLCWALGQTKDKARLKDLMLANLAGEYNEHISEESFLY